MEIKYRKVESWLNENWRQREVPSFACSVNTLPEVCLSVCLSASCVSLQWLQCEWLLGDRKPTPEELDKGIDPSSALFQAILENPVVQLGLTNPKTLLGKCHMFPQRNSRVCWLIKQALFLGLVFKTGSARCLLHTNTHTHKCIKLVALEHVLDSYLV